MKNTNNPTICYQCKYRGNISGDRHSCCKHPDAKLSNNPLNNFKIIITSISNTKLKSNSAIHKLNIQADEYGIRSGWFNFPWSFDPVWLKNCDGFENKEGGNNE